MRARGTLTLAIALASVGVLIWLWPRSPDAEPVEPARPAKSMPKPRLDRPRDGPPPVKRGPAAAIVELEAIGGSRVTGSVSLRELEGEQGFRGRFRARHLALGQHGLYVWQVSDCSAVPASVIAEPSLLSSMPANVAGQSRGEVLSQDLEITALLGRALVIETTPRGGGGKRAVACGIVRQP